MKTQDKLLALIYTFYPNVDTSGNVFAKRLYSEIRKPTIVITNKYLSNPPLDESLALLVNPYLYKRVEIDSPFTYRDWNHFQKYVEGSLTAYKNQIENGEIITTIYSRSMSVITHIAAFLIKQENPNLKWIAEFSDPILMDVDGSERETVIPENWIDSNHLKKLLQPFDNNRNLFFVSELLVYLGADRIVYTNPLQKKYMSSYLIRKTLDINLRRSLSKNIDQKSDISVHPTLEKKLYNMGNYKENLDKNYINIGYFGNINTNRNFQDFFEAWLSLGKHKKLQIRLYIYTNMNSNNILKNVPNELHNNTFVSKGLNYIDYLGVLNDFDYLLSVDTKVNDIFGVNPFLPSKISDYLGSNSKILALVEKGSPVDLYENRNIIKKYFDNIKLNDI